MDPERIYHDLVNAGESWADADAAANALEEAKKSVLADLMLKADAASAAAKEMYALADPIYRKHCESMVSARRVANRLKVRYDTAKVLAELRRTEEATKREEMRLAR